MVLPTGNVRVRKEEERQEGNVFGQCVHAGVCPSRVSIEPRIGPRWFVMIAAYVCVKSVLCEQSAGLLQPSLDSLALVRVQKEM
jgi:hypothetical protein